MSPAEIIKDCADRWGVSALDISAGGKLNGIRKQAARAEAVAIMYSAGYQRKVIARALNITVEGAWKLNKEWCKQ